MINATTVSSPFEIMTERSATSGAQAYDSGAPKFGSVLNNKIKDQYHTIEAKKDQPERVQDRPEPKIKAKDDIKAEPKDNPKVEAKEDIKDDAVQTDQKAESKADPKAEVKAQPKPQAETEQTAQNSNNAQPSADAAVAQTPNAQAVISVQQPAIDIKASDASTSDKVVVQTDTQTAKQVKIPIAAEGIVKQNITNTAQATAQAIKTEQLPKVEQVSTANTQAQAVSESEAVDTTGQNAATTANLPILNTKATDKSDAKPTESSNTKATFFGLTAKTAEQGSTGASSSQSEKNPGQNTSSENQTKNSIPLLASKRHESGRSFTQAENIETNGSLQGDMPKTATTKQPLDISGNMTFSPQVIKAITVDTPTQFGSPEAPVLSVTNENQTTATTLSTGDTQNAAIAMPARSSFDPMVRGLDAAQKAEVPTSSNADLQTKVIDQLVREVKLRQFQGQSDLTVKLNPAELGEIRLHITQTASGLTTQINASNEQVRGLLQAHIPALTSALADAGLKMDQVSVTSETSFGSLMQQDTSGAAFQQRNKTRQQHSGNTQDVTIHPSVINAAGGFGAAGSIGYSWLA